MKNIILKFLAWCCTVNVLVLMCCADSDKLPSIWIASGIFSVLYLVVLLIANYSRLEAYDGR